MTKLKVLVLCFSSFTDKFNILKICAKFCIIYLYNILGWASFPSIRPVIRPSKFLIPEEEDDGRGGRRRMAAAAVYPNVYVIQSCSL
jgi:hypothetical protein